jgi:hypothetical protein
LVQTVTRQLKGSISFPLDVRKTAVDLPFRQRLVDQLCGRMEDMGSSVVAIYAVHEALFILNAFLTDYI